MENFQLYKTNLSLGGQLKWDLVINNDNNKLYIDQFNITPISGNIPYTYNYDETILNNNHHDNIKAFYKKLEGYFYDEGLDTEFNINWPTITKENEFVNTYSNIYDMGCKRTKHYKRYNKQFEFFCPVWIEKITDSIMFKITVKGNDSNTILAAHSLCITSNNGHNIHDKFVNYFNNHIQYLGLNYGIDKVLNIKFNDQSYAFGIDTRTGMKCVKNITDIVKNMKTRERPVMEIDNMLMGCFNNNNLICNQLFNFNLCFNIDDIMSMSTIKLLKGKQLTISVDVNIDGEDIEKRDFYCNYDFIEKDIYYDETKNLPIDKLEQCKINYPEVFNKINVFDHLHDNECIDFITNNKYCQKICHWCLTENTDYLFNIYKGFEGYGIIVEKQNDNTYKPIIVENEHQYGNTPDISINKYSLSTNNTGWINCEEILYWNKFYNYIINTDKYKKIIPVYINNNKFVNGLKYKYTLSDTYMLGIKPSGKLYSTITNTYKSEIDWIADGLGLLIKDNLAILIALTWDNLTFANVRKYLYLLNENNWVSKDIYGNTITSIRPEYLNFVKGLFKMMQSVETPSIIVLESSLNWEYAKGPSKDIKEVTYYKSINTDYVFRYDGNIKPYFIKTPDIIYYKDYVSDNKTNGLSKLENSIYGKYANTMYEPIYPSIGYSALKKLSNYNKENIPTVTITEHGDIKLINNPEYSWFNNGKSLCLFDEIKFTYVNKKDNNSYKLIKDIVKDYLCEFYNIDDPKILQYIFNLYEYKSNWEYYSDTNIDDYIYKIELTLK